MKQISHRIFVMAAAAAAWLLAPAAAQAEVKAEVLNVKMKLTEQAMTQVQLSGLLHNRETLPVRGVQIRIRLLDPQNRQVDSFLLEPFEHLESGQTKPFSAQYLLKDYANLYLKAQAAVEYTPTSYLQIADWFLTQNWQNLKTWRIPVNDAELYHERPRLERALSYLEQIRPVHEVYSEARRKWNLVHYTYGKRLAEAGDGHEAMLRLANVEPASKHYAEAQELIREVRFKTIFDRALQKALEGNLRGAWRQMMYIPDQSGYAKEALAYRSKWLETLKAEKIWLGPVEAPPHLSQDQRSVWLRRQHGPEGYTSSSSSDGKRLRTWWYLDYSFYTFDEAGRLVNKQEF